MTSAVPCPPVIFPAEAVHVYVGVTHLKPPVTVTLYVRGLSVEGSGHERVTVGHSGPAFA